MTIKVAINQFRDYLIIERAYSPQTVVAYSNDLLSFANFLSKTKNIFHIFQVKQADVVSFLAYLASSEDGKKPNIASTRARKLASIRSFFTFLRKRKELVANPADDIDIPTIPLKEPDFLSEQEYQKLLAVIQRTASPFFKLRDFLIVSLFLSSGLRVSELVGLQLQDVDLVKESIMVHRKRNKYQTLPLNTSVVDLFHQYLSIRPHSDSKHVFVSKKHTRLRANSVFCMVRKYLLLAGINKSRSCHLLRHTCFTSLLAKGVNLIIIQAIANHSNLNTTKRYLHLNDIQIRDAVQTINLKGNI